jgi:hypothetical protein
MHQLKNFLQNLDIFFAHNLKEFVKFQKLANLLQTEGQQTFSKCEDQLFQNVKTHYISMLFPTKWVYSEFHPLMVKIHAKNQWKDVAWKNLNSLCDVEVILGLHCILLLFECVHTLIKVTQNKNVFVCFFVETMKVAQEEPYMSYNDPYTKFEDLAFDNFHTIGTLTNSNLPMEWAFDLNGGNEYLAFSFVGHEYHVYYICDDGVGDLNPSPNLH